ncbi:AAA family ATPase [Halovulum dunhuangense]|uniref:non-specific protein-tyrosine kinase n=1 Tax=Halovulum dunhuangense TaxID=1505036 RepID=A0A849L223_9RHOB|nr:tyrosine-protein kinase domain-containing protein [Halovulum dunhuangense]NNU80294.1 AAA family ATPase [Halovulum dunhuangense]
MRHEYTKTLEREFFGAGIGAAQDDGDNAMLMALWMALLRARYWLVGAALLGGIAAYALSYLFEVRYTSEAQVMIETRVTNDPAFAPGMAGLPTSITALESELEVLQSPDLIQRVVDRLDLRSDAEFAKQDEATDAGGAGDAGAAPLPADPDAAVVSAVRDRSSVEQIGNMSAVFSITFTSQDPEKAALLANTLAEEYIAAQIEEKLRALDRSQAWLSDRTTEIQERLTTLGVERENHILAEPYTPEDLQTMKASRASMERRIADLEAEAARLETTHAAIARLRADGNPLDAAAMIAVPGPELSQAIFEARAGDLAVLDAALDAAAARLSEEATATAASAASIRREADLTQAELSAQAERDAELRRIENDIRVSEAIYQDFMAQLSRRTQQDRYLNPDARIIATARPSPYPSEPRRKVMAVGAAFLATLGAAALVILTELRRTSLRTVGEYEGASGLPVLGLVPEASPKAVALPALLQATAPVWPGLMTSARKLYSSIVTELEAKPRGVSLRGRMRPRPAPEQASAQRLPALRTTKGQIIAGVSSMPGEGKSTALLLLARACTFAGERVLLVDCDFWHSPYRGTDGNELDRFTEALFDPEHSDRLIRETGENGLHLLPAPMGVEDPAAVLISEEFRALLEFLQARYDRVILDTPPLLAHVDTAALYRSADSILLMTRWNATPRGAVESTLRILSDVGVRPGAVVATRVNTVRAGAYGDNMFSHALRASA